MQFITHSPKEGTRYTRLEETRFTPMDDMDPCGGAGVDYNGRRFVDFPDANDGGGGVYLLTLPMSTAPPPVVDTIDAFRVVYKENLFCVCLPLSPSQGMLAPQPWLKMTLDVDDAQDKSGSIAMIFTKVREATLDNYNVACCQLAASKTAWHFLLLRREFHAALLRRIPAGSRLFVTLSTTATAPSMECGDASLYVSRPHVFEIADTAQLRAARGMFSTKRNAEVAWKKEDPAGGVQLAVQGVLPRDTIILNIAPPPLGEMVARALEQPLPPPEPVYVHLNPSHKPDSFLFTNDITPGALVCAMPKLLDVNVHMSLRGNATVMSLQEALPFYANGECESEEKLAKDLQAALQHHAPFVVTVTVQNKSDLIQLKVTLEDPVDPSACLIMTHEGKKIMTAEVNNPTATLNVQALLRPGRVTSQGWAALDKSCRNLNTVTVSFPSGDGGDKIWVGHEMIMERLRQCLVQLFPNASEVRVACAAPPPTRARRPPSPIQDQARIVVALLNSLPWAAHRHKLRASLDDNMRLRVECINKPYATAAIQQILALMDLLARYVGPSEVDKILQAADSHAAAHLHQRWLTAAPYYGALQSLREWLAPWRVTLEDIVETRLTPEMETFKNIPFMELFEGMTSKAVVIRHFFQDCPILCAIPQIELALAGVTEARVRVDGEALHDKLERKLREAPPTGADNWILDPSKDSSITADQDGGIYLRVFLRSDPYLHQQIQAVTQHIMNDISLPQEGTHAGGSKLGGRKKELTPQQSAMLAAMRRKKAGGSTLS